MAKIQRWKLKSWNIKGGLVIPKYHEHDRKRRGNTVKSFKKIMSRKSYLDSIKNLVPVHHPPAKSFSKFNNFYKLLS